MISKGFQISTSGDRSVGVWPVTFQITGGFQFQDADEMDLFVKELKILFESYTDETVSIDTFEEIERTEKILRQRP